MYPIVYNYLLHHPANANAAVIRIKAEAKHINAHVNMLSFLIFYFGPCLSLTGKKKT